MRTLVPSLALALILTLSCAADDVVSEPAGTEILGPDGVPWVWFMAPDHDRKNHEGTYKVYAHLLDFDEGEPITKGAGGKYSHHRGLYIGWKDTLVGDEDFDTWHLPNCYQQEINTTINVRPGESTMIAADIEWRSLKRKAFVAEHREMKLHAAGDGLRVCDFSSTLNSLAGTIPLKGDLQHAGVQVRMANEVSEHEETTEYTFPEGAEELDDDKVVGAWWMAVSCEVRGKRYSVLHMTPPDHPTGEPVYSIRRYARFGAFFEPTLEEGAPLDLNFRIVWTEKELDQATCQELYDAYAASREK